MVFTSGTIIYDLIFDLDGSRKLKMYTQVYIMDLFISFNCQNICSLIGVRNLYACTDSRTHIIRTPLLPKAILSQLRSS